MKRLISLLATTALLLTLLSAVPSTLLTSYAEYDGNFQYLVKNGEANLVSYVDSIGEVIIPATLGGAPVTNIEARAFRACDSVTSIIIPDSVITIESFAFSGCDALTAVYVGNGVTTIGDGAFSACPSLETISLGNSVSAIGEAAFADCPSLTTITVSRMNANYIAVDSVLYTKNMDTLVKYPSTIAGNCYVRSTVTTIEICAFDSCAALTSINIPYSVTKIGAGAFHGCASLDSLFLGSNIAEIGGSAFMGCDALTNVYYTGSEDMWSDIDIYNFGNEPLLNAALHTDCDPPYPKGDYSLDGKINMIDAFRFYTDVSKGRVPSEMIAIIDINNNGKADMVDVFAIYINIKPLGQTLP